MECTFGFNDTSWSISLFWNVTLDDVHSFDDKLGCFWEYLYDLPFFSFVLTGDNANRIS